MTQEGGGVSGFGIAEEEQKPLGGTGGAAGGGTRAGEGEPSGEGIGSGTTDAIPDALGSEEAKEAAALGDFDDHDETPALEYGEGDRPNGPTMGEAIGSGAGVDVGSGTPEDHAGLGGGGSPSGAASPGGNRSR